MTPLELLDSVRPQVTAHAALCYPSECCGVVVAAEPTGSVVYRPLVNIAAEADRFEFEPNDYAEAELEGDVLAIVHSHPNSAASPSSADREGCALSGVPWLIVSHPPGSTAIVLPDDWDAPYRGRLFRHAELDCYSLVQDWFRRELELRLIDVPRLHDWWETGEDLYMQHFEAAGFERCEPPYRRHDVILMRVKAPVTNHAAIYLGDGELLHHLHGRLSTEDLYDRLWQSLTTTVVRHRSMP